MIKGKVLALDYGTKRIGWATGDRELQIVWPGKVIANSGFLAVADEILMFCQEWDVKMIVIGWPQPMEENQPKNKVQIELEKFVNVLREQMVKNAQEIEIKLFDERLSSFEAEENLKQRGKKFAEIKNLRDAHSAEVILQRFFDTL